MLFSKRISALEGQVSDLQNQLATMTGERDEARTQLAGLENFVSPEAHQAVIAERDQFKADLANLRASMPEQVKKAASSKAVEIAASVGVPPIDKEATATHAQQTPSEQLAHYRSLPAGSAERTAYFKANKAAIYAAQRAEQEA